MANGYIETIDELKKLINLMTPTEVKAKEKAQELMDFFKPLVYCFMGSSMLTNDPNENVVIKNATVCANKVCDDNIETLNSVKGMGKIHKVKFWKLVKGFVQND